MLVVYDARVQYNQINVANLRNDGLQRFSFPGQLAEDHIANREPLLDNGNGMDFFGVPFASGGGVETAVKPLPADCRLTGIFDTIGELLKLLLVGDGEVDDVDDADDEQHDVAAVDDCSGEDSDSRRVGSFVTGDFGSAAAGGASSTSTQMFLILFLMLFLFLLLLLLLLLCYHLSSLLSLSVNDRLPDLRDVVKREQDDFFSIIKVIVIVTECIF